MIFLSLSMTLFSEKFFCINCLITASVSHSNVINNSCVKKIWQKWKILQVETDCNFKIRRVVVAQDKLIFWLMDIYSIGGIPLFWPFFAVWKSLINGAKERFLNTEHNLNIPSILLTHYQERIPWVTSLNPWAHLIISLYWFSTRI